MIIRSIYPKDMYTLVEFSLTQVGYILDYLDRCTFDVGKEPKMDEKGKEYVEKVFFKQLDRLTEEIEEQSNDITCNGS